MLMFALGFIACIVLQIIGSFFLNQGVEQIHKAHQYFTLRVGEAYRTYCNEKASESSANQFIEKVEQAIEHIKKDLPNLKTIQEQRKC